MQNYLAMSPRNAVNQSTMLLFRTHSAWLSIKNLMSQNLQSWLQVKVCILRYAGVVPKWLQGLSFVEKEDGSLALNVP